MLLLFATDRINKRAWRVGSAQESGGATTWQEKGSSGSQPL
ncbi:MAG: hypothetical protein RXO36_04010 [Candidatus Nanopusillus acidilobi]